MRALRPSTIAFYRDKLGPLVEALDGLPLEVWSRRELEDYIAEQDWAPRSVQMLVTACRTWITWARGNGLRMPDFVGELRAAKVTAPPREVL